MRWQVEAKISDDDVSGLVQCALQVINWPHLMMILCLAFKPSILQYHLLLVFLTLLVILVSYLFHVPCRVTDVIRSFKAGSAAGPNRLHPQHLKELTSHLVGDASSQLIEAITSFANLMLYLGRFQLSSFQESCLLMMLFISFVTVLLFPNSCICCRLLLPGGSRVIYRVLMRPFVLVCNINFGPTVWAQSILPTAKGGLVICSVVDLCLPGFLSSCHGTSDLVASLLSPSGITGDDSLLLEAIN